MAELHVHYENFAGGEFGHVGPAKAAPGTFTGRNVVVYQDGCIGPRAGLKAYGSHNANGVVLGMGFNGTTGAAIWYNVGTGIFSFATALATPDTWTGSLASATTLPVPLQWVEAPVSHTQIINPLDKAYDLNHLTKTVTAIAASPAGSVIATYGTRLFVARTTANLRRVFFSADGDYTTWPAGNFFDIGNRGAVVGMWAQRDSLAILMQDGEWWILRGIPTDSTISGASLRRATAGGVHPWVNSQNSAAILGSDEIVWIPNGADWPAVFNGVTVSEKRQVGPDGNKLIYSTQADVRVIRGYRQDEAAILTPNNASTVYLLRNGVWTLHTLTGVTFSQFAASDQQGLLYLCDGGAAGAHANFYTLRTGLDRPAFTSDTDCSPGDLSNTPLLANFSMPEWWANPDQEVEARHVVVDIVKYQTGVTNNTMTLVFKKFGAYLAPGDQSPAAQSWTDAGANASTTGTHDRIVFDIGDQGWAAGFQVGLSGIAGIKIKSITVITEPRTVPRWSARGYR